MSSAPFCLGIPVMDEPKFTKIGSIYVLRAKDEDELCTKLSLLQRDTPNTSDVLVYVIGYRPDAPVPVSRYFVEIRFREHEDWCNPSLIGWTGVFQGTKVVLPDTVPLEDQAIWEPAPEINESKYKNSDGTIRYPHIGSFDILTTEKEIGGADDDTI